jgi:hypothetical protein
MVLSALLSGFAINLLLPAGCEKEFSPPAYPLCSLSHRERTKGRKPAFKQGVETAGG